MTCTATTHVSEFDFVVALHDRGRDLTACCGPMLTLELSLWRVFTLEQIFESEAASELLWDGHLLDEPYGTDFSLCGGHWLDLAALVWLRSRQSQRKDWYAEADQLLRDVCRTARWDPKEIVNMFKWQSTRLT